MNIINAFNKLKKNPNLTVKYQKIRYKYVQINDTIWRYDEYGKSTINIPGYEGKDFSLEEILSKDWEVVE